MPFAAHYSPVAAFLLSGVYHGIPLLLKMQWWALKRKIEVFGSHRS